MKPQKLKFFLRGISYHTNHTTLKKKIPISSYLRSEVLISKGRDDEDKYRGFGNQEQKN